MVSNGNTRRVLERVYVIMIEEDDEPNFVPERILEKRGTKYLIRWKGMDEASDAWLSKSMPQRGSAIHQMMTATDTEEETVKACRKPRGCISWFTPIQCIIWTHFDCRMFARIIAILC